MMNEVSRLAAPVALVAAFAVAVVVAGAHARTALTLREAAREAALEARVLDDEIAFLERRIAAQPGHPLLNGMLVDRYAERFRLSADQEDVRRATDVARRLVADRPRDSDGWVRLARVLLTQHDFPAAHAAAARAAELNPGDDAALGGFVDAARASGHYEAADSALAGITVGSVARVLRTWSAMADAGMEAQARRRLMRACARFDELGRSRDARAWCRVRLADAALVAGRRGEAERWLEAALRIQPESRGAIETSAALALEGEDWSEAVRLLERIATPAHPDIYLTLGRAYRGMGQRSKAIQAEARFLELAEAPEALDLNALFLARYYADGGRDCARARRLVARELARRPSLEVLNEGESVAEACGDPERAKRLRGRADAIMGRKGRAAGEASATP